MLKFIDEYIGEVIHLDSVHRKGIQVMKPFAGGRGTQYTMAHRPGASNEHDTAVRRRRCLQNT